MSSPVALPRGARRALGRADLATYRWVRGGLHHAEVTPRVAAFSRLGEHAALWLGIGAVGAAVDRGRRPRWLRGLSLVAGAYVANTAVKNVIGRQRPAFEEFPHLVKTPTQLSFPSAHATSSFCAAAAYRGLLPAGPLYAAATAMAVSRVVLGVHYPSDIVAGAALGTVVGTLGRQSP
ncbi:phosphatase PAP2 family protein [Paraconexibacter sp.]|uniref:phosphatase PAP2 family protein n=1 Tax=Paraconexibacter sp. TaxID=2949640 RepID=UPI003562C7B8